MSHEELLLAIVTLMVTSITAPMLIAWWNNRLREHGRDLERARQEGRAEGRRSRDECEREGG